MSVLKTYVKSEDKYLYKLMEAVEDWFKIIDDIISYYNLKWYDSAVLRNILSIVDEQTVIDLQNYLRKKDVNKLSILLNKIGLTYEMIKSLPLKSFKTIKALKDSKIPLVVYELGMISNNKKTIIPSQYFLIYVPENIKIYEKEEIIFCLFTNFLLIYLNPVESENLVIEYLFSLLFSYIIMYVYYSKIKENYIMKEVYEVCLRAFVETIEYICRKFPHKMLLNTRNYKLLEIQINVKIFKKIINSIPQEYPKEVINNIEKNLKMLLNSIKLILFIFKYVPQKSETGLNFMIESFNLFYTKLKSHYNLLNNPEYLDNLLKKFFSINIEKYDNIKDVIDEIFKVT